MQGEIALMQGSSSKEGRGITIRKRERTTMQGGVALRKREE
jgi:hypothetical protein